MRKYSYLFLYNVPDRSTKLNDLFSLYKKSGKDCVLIELIITVIIFSVDIITDTDGWK